MRRDPYETSFLTRRSHTAERGHKINIVQPSCPSFNHFLLIIIINQSCPLSSAYVASYQMLQNQELQQYDLYVHVAPSINNLTN